MYLSTTTCRLIWGPRREDITTCAELTLGTLNTLQALGYKTFLKSPKRADGEIDVSVASISALLTKGINHTDIGRKPIPELGFSLSTWSGGTTLESYTLTVHCGCYSEHVPNTVVFSLPPQGPYCFELFETPAREAFRALVKIWRPDSAHLCESNAGFANETFPSPEAKIYDAYNARAA